jgi:hypothetical protein
VGRNKSTRVCAIKGCGKPHRSLGMCVDHYNEWYIDNVPAEKREPRKGNYAPRNSTLADRLIMHTKEVEGGHIVWTASMHDRVPTTSPNKNISHRNVRNAIWVDMLGKDIPDGKSVGVLPDCPAECVNEDHLVLKDKGRGDIGAWVRANRGQQSA